MIAHLHGLILDITDHYVVVDVHGVGYQVFCSTQTLKDLNPQESCKLHIETIVREDLIQLYGFVSAVEKQAFQILRTVQGVGMKMALSILSVIPAMELPIVIMNQDKIRLTQADGVGPKLALRIFTELKDKIHSVGGMSQSNVISIPQGALIHDATSVLVNLGYKRNEAQTVAQKVYDEMNHDDNIEVLIRQSLKVLTR